MSEDDDLSRETAGNSFPLRDDVTQESKIMPLDTHHALPDEELKYFEKRSREHWPKYRVSLYRHLLIEYASSKSLSPQQLYDLIMEPEIEQRIRDYRARHGVELSSVEARPHPDGNGRDIIRKWLYRTDGTVAEGFLKFVRRFIRSDWKTFIRYRDARKKVQLERTTYQCAALKDMINGDTLLDVRGTFLKVGARHFYALLPKKNDTSHNEKLLQLRIHESMIGELLIFESDTRLSTHDAKSKFIPLHLDIAPENLRLRYRG